LSIGEGIDRALDNGQPCPELIIPINYELGYPDMKFSSRRPHNRASPKSASVENVLRLILLPDSPP
jgi:hypothetical protein